MDYRNSAYCPSLDGIEKRKLRVAELVKADHPRVKNMYTYVSKNDDRYKDEFIKAYNGKCSYCGASVSFVSKRAFEIDHYIYKESEKFKSKVEAGNIDNLVLSCNYCNSKKSDFNISDEYIEKLNPDKSDICRCFIRNEDYYIEVSDENAEDMVINDFFKQLNLGSELRRLDYLLLNLTGLKKMLSNVEGMGEVYKKLDKMTMLLTQKRNML